MHIVIVSHNYPFEFDHTFGFFCKQQAEALENMGHKIGVVIPLFYSLKYIISKKRILFGRSLFNENGVSTYLFYFPAIPKMKRLKHKLMRRIGLYLFKLYVEKNGKPDIVHLHTFVAAEVAAEIAKLFSIKIVWTEHFTDIRNNRLNRFEQHLVRLASTTATIRIAVSENFAEYLSNKLGCMFLYIPNVYNSKIFKLPSRVNKPDGFRFVSVGHLSERKNQKGLLQAFKKSFENTNVRLAIIGEGALERSFQLYVNELHLTEQVDLFDSLPIDQVYSQMLSSHAFVLSSEYETFGVVLIEAMACGLPLIATRCGGPESIVTNSSLGILVEKDIESIAKGMLQLYNDYSTYDSRYISSAANDLYSYEAVAHKLTEVYNRCV